MSWWARNLLTSRDTLSTVPPRELSLLRHPMALSETKITTRVYAAITGLLPGIHALKFKKQKPRGERTCQLKHFPLCSVDSLMLGEIGLTAESFPTAVTPVGLLPSVDSVVLIKIGAVVEGLPTLRTLIGLLSCVESLMGTKACVLTKALPTFITLIRFLPCVYSIVANEAAFPTESFATIFTLIRCLFCVHSLMFKEVRALTEGFPALTVIRPVLQVGPIMQGQI